MFHLSPTRGLNTRPQDGESTRGKVSHHNVTRSGVRKSQEPCAVPVSVTTSQHPDTQTQRETHGHMDTETQSHRHTDPDRLNAKRPACQSIQLTDASQNSLTVAELLRKWWAHVVLSRSVTYILGTRCVIMGVVSWLVQFYYVCDHTFFVELAHCA